MLNLVTDTFGKEEKKTTYEKLLEVEKNEPDNTSLKEKDMLWAKFPRDEDYRKNKIREHALMVER